MQQSKKWAPEVLESGRIVLQWCVATVVAVKISQHAIKDHAHFAAIEYLAQHGGFALACTPEQCEDHAQRNAARSLLPAPVTVTTPWPESLGAGLGGPSKMFENACLVASDIVTDGDVTRMRVGRHHVLCDIGKPLIALFDNAACGHQGEFVEAALRIAFEHHYYAVGAQRTTPLSGAQQYSFRFLRCGLSD